MRVRSFALGLVVSLAAASGADAVQQSKSRYSTVDLSKCQKMQSTREQRAWMCPGLPGFPLYIAVSGRRTFVSPGPNGQKRLAAQQSLPSASSLFDGKSRRAAVEWRFVIRDKRVVPYATIVRYFTQGSSGRSEVVVVTKIDEQQSCQVAHIDALANSDAMVLARTIADRKARTFDCNSQPETAGVSGKSVR